MCDEIDVVALAGRMLGVGGIRTCGLMPITAQELRDGTRRPVGSM